MYLLSPFDWWQLLSMPEQVFWVIALFASVFFVILFVISLLGVGGDTDTDFDTDHDTGHDFHLDKEFSAFSIRSIVAFLTFFGWTGVYLLSRNTPVALTVVISVLSGTTAMLVVAYMIYKFAQMEKSGTVNVQHALDQTGEVYLTIPQHMAGKGKIHIVVGGSLHEFDAGTHGDAIPTGNTVRVVDILDDEMLLVEPVVLHIEDNPST